MRAPKEPGAGGLTQEGLQIRLLLQETREPRGRQPRKHAGPEGEVLELPLAPLELAKLVGALDLGPAGVMLGAGLDIHIHQAHGDRPTPESAFEEGGIRTAPDSSPQGRLTLEGIPHVEPHRDLGFEALAHGPFHRGLLEAGLCHIKDAP